MFKYDDLLLPPGIKELKVYCTIKFGTIRGQWLANVINPFSAMFPFYTLWKHQEVQNENIGQNCVNVINPFVHNAPFLYLLKTENRKVFWCFQGVEKGCIGNEWVNVDNRKSFPAYSIFRDLNGTCTFGGTMSKYPFF